MKKLILIAMVVGLVLCNSGTLLAQPPPCLPGVKAAPVEVVNPPSNPVPVTGNLNVSGTLITPCCYRFIGYTSAKTTGNAGGIGGMNAFCQAEFGATARICDSYEFLHSPFPVPTSTTTTPEAWVETHFISAVWNGAAVVLVDYSGFSSPSSLNCSNWITNSGDGLCASFLSPPGGTFAKCSCPDANIPVACCAP
jgi:hypothetical protein